MTATGPERPWVTVIGAHRSGTSAVTGALVALGLQGVDPADRMAWEASNPEHWESLAAALFDDALLAEGGGTWDAPPSEGWAPDVDTHRDRAAAVLAAAYPGAAPPVWKDPRASLLLPFWRAVLPGPLTAVLVWRDPLSVARSLHHRDGLPVAYGLALWARYVRSAAEGLQGVDTYVLDYASVVADPAGALGGVAGWLAGLDRFAPWAGAFDVQAAAATIDAGLRHQEAAEGAGADAEALAGWLTGITGGHTPFAATPPEGAAPEAEALLTGGRALARRMVEALAAAEAHERELERGLRDGYGAELERQQAEMELLRTELAQRDAEIAVVRRQAAAATAELERLQESTSWKVTAPLRSATARLGRGH